MFCSESFTLTRVSPGRRSRTLLQTYAQKMYFVSNAVKTLTRGRGLILRFVNTHPSAIDLLQKFLTSAREVLHPCTTMCDKKESERERWLRSCSPALAQSFSFSLSPPSPCTTSSVLELSGIPFGPRTALHVLEQYIGRLYIWKRNDSTILPQRSYWEANDSNLIDSSSDRRNFHHRFWHVPHKRTRKKKKIPIMKVKSRPLCGGAALKVHAHPCSNKNPPPPPHTLCIGARRDPARDDHVTRTWRESDALDPTVSVRDAA